MSRQPSEDWTMTDPSIPLVRWSRAGTCGLGRFIPIHDDKLSALAAFAREGTEP